MRNLWRNSLTKFSGGISFALFVWLVFLFVWVFFFFFSRSPFKSMQNVIARNSCGHPAKSFAIFSLSLFFFFLFSASGRETVFLRRRISPGSGQGTMKAKVFSNCSQQYTDDWHKKRFWLVCWLLSVPATCECISGTDLLRQFYVLPH